MSLPVFARSSSSLNLVQQQAIAELHALVYGGELRAEPVMRCFCGASDFRLLSRFDRFGLPFGTQICRACGLISQTLRLHPDSMALFYDRIYWPLVIGTRPCDASSDAYVTRPKRDEAVSFVLPWIRTNGKPLAIFEVGCGAGIRISRLKDELTSKGIVTQAFGCDYSSDALSKAAARGIETVQGGFDEIARFGKADVLILSHVFEHLPDLTLALTQIGRLVHDESIIYIEVPGVIDLENKAEYGFDYQVYCVLAHTYNFSLQSLVNVMASGGFRLVAGDEYARSVFVKGQPEAGQSAYKPIIAALERAYRKQLMLEARRNRPLTRYFRNVAKALLGRTMT